MRVLIASTVFAPSVGGTQTVAALLARGLVAEGHAVRVITLTEGNGWAGNADCAIVRSPSPLRVFRCVSESDAVILMGPTLKLGWPLILLNRKALISHHIGPPADGNPAVRLLRRLLCNRATHVACSRVLAARMGSECTVVENPYDDDLFTAIPDAQRAGDLIFLGRLVPEKGLDVLLKAMAILSQRGLNPCLKVVGDGPSRGDLERTAGLLGLEGRVEFLGTVVGKQLAALLNRQRILVVPSTCEETFGLAAMEGIACGCVVVGSSGGGLPDAIGACGVTFPTGHADQLARAIEALLRDQKALEGYRRAAPGHLQSRSPNLVARQLLARLCAA